MIEDIANGPVSVLNLIALAVSAVTIWLAVRAWRSRPAAPGISIPTTTPPGALSAPLAGALVLGNINQRQLVAGLLDLAQRGALAIEPESAAKARLRLLDPNVARGDFEHLIWTALEAAANGERIVPNDRILNLLTSWPAMREALRADLVARGWFAADPNASRATVIRAGMATLLLAIAAIALSAIGGQGWGFAGAGLLAVSGVVALVIGIGKRETTPGGEQHALPWRGYQQGLKQSGDNGDLNLDRAVPYAVAMHTLPALRKRIQAASASGYSPPWLGPQSSTTWGADGFYPAFIAFHNALAPDPTSSEFGEHN